MPTDPRTPAARPLSPATGEYDVTPSSDVTGESVSLPPRPSPPPPARFPGYDIIGQLGTGGMGVVYKARDTALDRVVTIKTLLPGGQVGPEAAARFLVEARSAAAIRHQHVVQVYGFGETAAGPFIVMEYLAGGSLADWLKANTLMSPPSAAQIVTRLALGLAAAHAKGVVHRDLKPANVLFDEANRPKVADFGLARIGESVLTRMGQVVGTPAYMAPEQADRKAGAAPPGPPADVWSLGVILYECLTGTVPFAGGNWLEVLKKVATAPIEPPSARNPGVPKPLDAICLRCLDRDPSKRPTAAQLADDLKRFRQGESAVQPAVAEPPPPAREPEVFRLIEVTAEVAKLADADIPPPPPRLNRPPSGAVRKSAVVRKPDPRRPREEPAPTPARTSRGLVVGLVVMGVLLAVAALAAALYLGR